MTDNDNLPTAYMAKLEELLDQALPGLDDEARYNVVLLLEDAWFQGQLEMTLALAGNATAKGGVWGADRLTALLEGLLAVDRAGSEDEVEAALAAVQGVFDNG